MGLKRAAVVAPFHGEYQSTNVAAMQWGKIFGVEKGCTRGHVKWGGRLGVLAYQNWTQDTRTEVRGRGAVRKTDSKTFHKGDMAGS